MVANHILDTARLGDLEETLKSAVTLLTSDLSPPILAPSVSTQIWTLVSEIALHTLQKLKEKEGDETAVSHGLETLIRSSVLPRCQEERREELTERAQALLG